MWTKCLKICIQWGAGFVLSRESSNVHDSHLVKTSWIFKIKRISYFNGFIEADVTYIQCVKHGRLQSWLDWKSLLQNVKFCVNIGAQGLYKKFRLKWGKRKIQWNNLRCFSWDTASHMEGILKKITSILVKGETRWKSLGRSTRHPPGKPRLAPGAHGDGASGTDPAHNEKATFTLKGGGGRPQGHRGQRGPALLRHSEAAAGGPGPWRGLLGPEGTVRRACISSPTPSRGCCSRRRPSWRTARTRTPCVWTASAPPCRCAAGTWPTGASRWRSPWGTAGKRREAKTRSRQGQGGGGGA